ncbi:MAG: hypothetical protein JXB07_10360 [Anaerolineae bacterium]|nr:hypothetical protein [Anaerolineae bacterium]
MTLLDTIRAGRDERQSVGRAIGAGPAWIAAGHLCFKRKTTLRLTR